MVDIAWFPRIAKSSSCKQQRRRTQNKKEEETETKDQPPAKAFGRAAPTEPLLSSRAPNVRRHINNAHGRGHVGQLRPQLGQKLPSAPPKKQARILEESSGHDGPSRPGLGDLIHCPQQPKEAKASKGQKRRSGEKAKRHQYP